MEETEFQQDLITMITVVTFDRFGVIRDYLYERDENGEYFFGISKGNKLEVYLRPHRKICTNTLLRKVRDFV